MHVRRISIVLINVALLACSEKPTVPATPSMSSSPEQTVGVNDRIAWDQTAADAAELGTFQYAIYVDGTRSELPDVTCATVPVGGTFVCSARLPSMSPGRHLLELAAFVTEGGSVLESARSQGLRITFVGVLTPAPSQGSGLPVVPAVAALNRTGGDTAPSFLADGLEQVSDLAFAPDGRLFIAERTGRVRVMRDGALVPQPALAVRLEPDGIGHSAGAPDGAGAVLALAVDPQFDRTHFVYVLSTTSSPRRTLTFVLARYREAADTLADRVVLLDDVPAASPDPAGALRFGPDAKLYVAFDAGGDARLPGDLASPNGKVLRLNADGTTPEDQAGASPLYSSPYQSPRGLGWETESGIMWVVDAAAGGVAQVNAVGVGSINGRKRGVTKATVSLPPPDEPSALAVLRDSVLIASVLGEPLVRCHIDPSDRTRLMETEPLRQNEGDAVQALAVAPDGAVYFATARAIGRFLLQ
jgi:glucose/arabinose dehydrogenase